MNNRRKKPKHTIRGVHGMRLENYNEEEIENMSLIDLAKLVLLQERQPLKFNEAFEKVSELKGLTEAQKQAKISQFYTELNVDGNFIMNGQNTWGLKRWYRVEKEEAAPIPRKRRRKVVEVDEVDIDVDEFDMLDENIDHMDEEDLEDLDVDIEEDLNVDFSDEEGLDDKEEI